MAPSPRCLRCRHASHCAQHRTIRFIHRDRLRECMWINQHVHRGYRPTKLPWHLCLRSAFCWNNETINIWSHLLGFLYFSYCQLHTNLYRLPEIGGDAWDHVVISLSLLGAQLCMLLSTSYHVFGCTGPKQRERWLKLDVFGVSAGLLGMYLSGIYTAFYCFDEFLKTYLYILGMFFLITAYVPVHRDFLDRPVLGSRIGALHLIYSAVVAFGICPTIHWVILHGGIDNEHVSEWLPSIVTLYSLLCAAFFFYASMVPERLMPGVFDVFGCSHQWWHLLILSAMVYWQESGIALLTLLRTRQTCDRFIHLLSEPHSSQSPIVTNMTNSY